MARHVAVVLALLAASSIAAADQQAVQITISSVNVRSGAGTGFPIIGSASSGQKYVVAAVSGTWKKVWWEGGPGWVYSGYTALTSGTGARVDVAALNVRSSPSTSSSIVGSAESPQVYAQASTSGVWKSIWFGGSVRWIHGGYTTPIVLSTTAPPPPSDDWTSAHLGITKDGSAIPRQGLSNGTLLATLGVAVEPYGTVVTYGGRTFVRGKVSWFGGPTDSGTAGETMALTGEWCSSYNNPTNPSAAYLASHLEKYYYCAMRWNYSPNGTAWWRNQRILVINPANGKAVVVRPVDWGPNTSTGRTLDISPRALDYLGMTTDQNAVVAFAPAGTALGPK